jgi:hypothetical protein
MNKTTPRTLALLWLFTAWLPLQVSASTSNEWRFQVFLDEKPIGFHHFRLNTAGDTRELRGEARFSVKLLGFTVYDYSHQNLELWQQGCLQHIEASTDDNGRNSLVRGNSNGEELMLKDNNGNRGVSGCVMTFAYWNPEILDQQKLLNAQTGEYLDISVQPLGEKTLQLQGRKIPALHYRLSTNENDIDLWYSSDRDWLALSTTISGGRQLHYRRVATVENNGSVDGEHDR